jgi:lysophospholipase L1-like esterase
MRISRLGTMAMSAAAAGVAVVAMLAVGAAWAGTIVGTSKGDILRGSPHNDKIYGKAGNDRLYGYGGDDLLVGGAGADVLACGAGRDVAIADKNDKVIGCEVVKGLPKPPPPPPPPPPAKGGLYLALGDSISSGLGFSVPWVSLYFNYLVSSGSGVTDLLNVAQGGATSASLLRDQLPRAVAVLDSPFDTLRVTIDIGLNDIRYGVCDRANDETCALAGNLRLLLKTLNAALARDPGNETVQIMEYYNFDIATPRESVMRAKLLGDDLKIDCSAHGPDLGLNDLIHCIALEENAVPVDVLPAFDAAGAAYVIDDGHPNDAGNHAIARAFGGDH